MKNMYEFKFDYMKTNWTVIKTKHIHDKRGSAQGDYSRDEFLDNQRYTEIFKCALRNGLTSFREKDLVVVTLPSEVGAFYAVLCKLDKYNRITIISVFRKKTLWWKCYIKVRNRITVFHDYVIPRMNKTDIQHKQMTKIQHNIVMEKENDVFMNVMGSIKDLVRF